MTIDDIRKRVDYIDRICGDDEVAHGEEDQLMEDFISYVAEVGNKKLSVMAKEVLKTKEIEFCRWCA